MTVKIREIQVCGGKIVTSLKDACKEYLHDLPETDRPKLHFTIILADGQVKHITFRQWNGDVVAYGNFDGLPSFLEFAQEA